MKTIQVNNISVKNLKKNKIEKLRNFFVLMFFIFFLSSINFNSANSINSYYSSPTPLKHIINKDDPTTYEDLKFIKKETNKTVDRRYGEGLHEATFFIFEAKYQIGEDIQIWVNSEFKTHENIAEAALKYSKMIGKLPIFFRKELKWIVIHGPWEDKSKCTCAWYAMRNAGVYIHTEMIREEEQQETLIHELAHVTIDMLYYGSANEIIWTQAQKEDAKSISRYAKKNPLVEDIAESVVAWVAVRCKKDRISNSVYKKIIKTIPNRLTVLDDLIFRNSQYPLICKK